MAIAVGVVWTTGSWLLVGLLSFDRDVTRLQGHLGDVSLIAPIAAMLLASMAWCSWSSRWRRTSWIAAGAVTVVWAMATLGYFLDVT